MSFAARDRRGSRRLRRRRGRRSSRASSTMRRHTVCFRRSFPLPLTNCWSTFSATNGIVEIHQRRPVRADIVDRERDVVEAHFLRDHRQVGFRDRFLLLISIISPPNAGWAGMPRQRSRTAVGLPEVRYGQVDRKIDRALPLQEVAPVLDGAFDHEFREAAKMRVVVFGNEIGRWDHAPGRMPHPDQRFRTAGSACGRRSSADTTVRASRPAGPRRHGRPGSAPAPPAAAIATLSRRLAAPKGVCSEGSIAMPYSSPICRTAFTMIELGWPMTRTLPSKFLRTSVSGISRLDAVGGTR